jgi:hypothetical protein
MAKKRPITAIRELIEDLTVKTVAEHCKVRRQAVDYWARKGVPAEHVLRLVALSKTARRPKTPSDFRPDLYPRPAAPAQPQPAQEATG